MTLVEVLVTLAVLSIMTVPIFDTFLKSMEINHKTMSTVSANHVGQQALETLKSDGAIVGFTVTDKLNDDGSLEKTIHTGELDGYQVEAVFTTIDGIAYAPSDAAKVDFGNTPNIADAELTVIYQKNDGDSQSLFKFDGSDEDGTWAKLIISKNGSSVDLVMSMMKKQMDDTWKEVATGKSKVIASDADLDIVVKLVGTPDKGRIDIENQSDTPVNIYEVDDKVNMLKVVPKVIANKGEIKLYRNLLSDSADGDNQQVVYNVEVKVSKNSTVLERFVGTVVK